MQQAIDYTMKKNNDNDDNDDDDSQIDIHAAIAKNDGNDNFDDNEEAPLAGVRFYCLDEKIIAAATVPTQTTTTTTAPPPSDYSFPHPSPSSSDSEDEEEDDSSTSTVVHNDCPPPPINATTDEINKLYWEWCYGPLLSSSSSSSSLSSTTTVAVVQDSEGGIVCSSTSSSNPATSYSGKREGLLPGKSCLSSRKNEMPTTKKKSISRDSMTPRRLHLHHHHHHSPPLNDDENNGGGSNSAVVGTNNFSTPPDDYNNGSGNNDVASFASTNATTTATQQEVVKQRPSAVKFGTNTAAMFDSQLPITVCMTPIPYDDVQLIFPMIEKYHQAAITTTSTNNNDATTTTTTTTTDAIDSRETARNIKLLAKWDDDFDNYTLEEDDDIYYNNLDDDDDDIAHDTGVENNCNGSSSSSSLFSQQTKNIVGLATPGGRTMKRGRKRTPSTRKQQQQQQQQQRLSSASRRKSSIFSSAGGGKYQRHGLIDFDNESDDGECGLLPFAITINPDEYVSPTSTSTSTTTTATTNQGTSISLVGIMTPAGTATNTPMLDNNDDKEIMSIEMTARDSLESVYVSPGSFKSSASSTIMTSDFVRGDVNEGCYYHHEVNNKDTQNQQQQRERESFDSTFSISSSSSSSSNAASATPNSARTSSSTLLRAVHASGALLHGSNNNNKDGYHDNNNITNNVNNDNSRLRPNQLKYSPRSSNGSSSSSNKTLLGETFTSPSDKSNSGCNSLSFDIMSLFTNQFIGDDTITDIDQQYSPTNSTTTTTDQQPPYLTLDKQLLMLSNHPMQSFHTSIFDLMQWNCSSTYVDTDIMTFLMNVLSMKVGLSPSTIFDIIVYGIEQFRLLFSGKSFGTILMEEIETMTTTMTSTSCFNHTIPTQHDGLNCNDIGSSSTADADCQTISSSIQKYYQSACLDWSRLEMEVADRALIRLRSWAESMEMQIQEFDNVLSTTIASYTKLMNADSMTELSILPRPRRGKKKRQTTQARIDTMCSNVASLEDELAMEVNRFEQLIRAKQLFDARWDVERYSPISALYVEIRTSIRLLSPIVVGHGMTRFSFQLLNGSAEIIMEIVNISNNDDDYDVSVFSGVSQLGCFIKDGGASMKFLKAILVGNDSDVKMRVDNSSFGPYPLRTSLSSFIIGEVRSSNCFRDEILHRSSLIVSRIDTLVRSVREVEVDCYTFCVDVDKNGTDGSLSISLSHETNIELVVQINFSFDNLLHDSWCIMSLAPTNVHVSIISKSNNEVSQSSLLLGNQMQERARRMIHAKSNSSSSTSDSILLRLIWLEMKGMFFTIK